MSTSTMKHEYIFGSLINAALLRCYEHHKKQIRVFCGVIVPNSSNIELRCQKLADISKFGFPLAENDFSRTEILLVCLTPV